MNDFQIAVPTSFHADESLNYQATMQHMMHLYEQGTRSVLVCGSTGEQHSLRLEEKKKLLEHIDQYDFPDDLEIIFGVSSTRQLDAVELSKEIAENTKISAIMLGFPPYLMLSQEDALQYCNVVIHAALDKSVILYNNPRRTGFDLQVETMIKILKNPAVVGVKEAGDMDKVHQLWAQMDRNILIFYGGDDDLVQAVVKGYNALSSIVGNVYPKEIAAYFGQIKEKPYINREVQNKIDELYTKPLLPYIKKLISQKENVVFGKCRLPLGADFE